MEIHSNCVNLTVKSTVISSKYRPNPQSFHQEYGILWILKRGTPKGAPQKGTLLGTPKGYQFWGARLLVVAPQGGARGGETTFFEPYAVECSRVIAPKGYIREMGAVREIHKFL